MSKAVTLYRVFVASPGDCREERQLIREVIFDWNAVYGHACNTYLEPVLWETHARPALGDRPQAIINQQLLRDCDLLLGVFKRRLGTPTGVAASGTAEEVEEFRRARKPVLLYFHTEVPSAELDGYRAAMSRQGLVWSYGGLWELTRDVARHLAGAMADLAGTPRAQVTFANEPSAQTPLPAVPVYELSPHLMRLREATQFLWTELETLPPGATQVSAELRQATFDAVREALDALASGGHLRFRTEFAYVASMDGSPVLEIHVSDITAALREAIDAIVRAHGRRPPLIRHAQV